MGTAVHQSYVSWPGVRLDVLSNNKKGFLHFIFRLSHEDDSTVLDYDLLPIIMPRDVFVCVSIHCLAFSFLLVDSLLLVPGQDVGFGTGLYELIAFHLI